MMVRAVLLPVFILIGLTFALLMGMARTRGGALESGGIEAGDAARGEANWRNAALRDGFRDQFELPVLFYILVALALPLRHADLVIVMLAWVFVVTRFAHAGIFITSNDGRNRSLAWYAGALVLMAMWLYFALKILLLI
jgi:hypothetical protein